MSAATITSIPGTAGQDRPRHRSLPLLVHWRAITGSLALAGLLLAAAVEKQRSLDIFAAVVTTAVVVIVVMERRARIVHARLARIQKDSDPAAMLDLGSAARASHSLDDFLNNIAQGLSAMTGASPVSILLREPASGRFYCRYRYPTLSVGLNSDVIWLEKDAFSVRRLRTLSMPLVVDPADYSSWVESMSGPARLRRRFECDVLTALDSRMLVQVIAQDELSAIVSIGPGSSAFDTSMKRMMVAVANQVSLAIENSSLVKRVAEGERLRREIEMAAEVQRKLLPGAVPNFDRLQIATFFQPARDVGGDYFDFFPIDSHRLGICVADVAGKGLAAALLMSTVKALLRSHAAGDSRGTRNVAAVVAGVNRLLCQFTDAPRYTTLFYAEFDDRTHALEYVNAGHNPPHVLRSDGTLPLTIGGPVLGLFADAVFEQDVVPLFPGEALVACTDGVLEACNPAGLEFGDHNVLRAMRVQSVSADTMLNSALRELRAWSDGMPFEDDATLLVARVT